MLPNRNLERHLKNPYTVLRKKEQDLEQVRKQVKALYLVIPLLVDEVTSSEGLKLPAPNSFLSSESVEHGMADLKRYYPFVRYLHK